MARRPRTGWLSFCCRWSREPFSQSGSTVWGIAGERDRNVSEILLRGAAKRFGASTVLDDVSLSVPEGSITAILGRSGSGKTTLLRIIAGFERLDAGSLNLGGRLVDDGVAVVPAQARGIGYVPPDGALFP